MKTLRIDEIGRLTGGRVAGDGSIPIRGAAALEEAGPGDVSFLASARYTEAAARTRASAVLVPMEWAGRSPAALIRVANPDAAFARVVEALLPPVRRPEPGVHPSACVAEDVALGCDVSVGPQCVLEAG
ncbi:MAG: UDP-3-O-(3-hydroxymyristoyl)glucosamine N-acyltransferase, partial [Lentisphaerae bacterium]|nr:UDP-3-O-(3-hydroxymyristoyl)glucosamine N-acyltransferase [Lentisphaerota bacterium]